MSPCAVTPRPRTSIWKAVPLLAALACVAVPLRQRVEAAAIPLYYPTDLTLASRTTRPFQLNDNGRVVGSLTRRGTTGVEGFVWQDGQVTQLPKLKFKAAIATGINNLGEIVGGATQVSPELWHLLIWRNDQPTDLGSMVISTGGRAVGAFDINDQGQIVGGSGRAFLRDGDVTSDLGTLGGTGSEAFAINEAGVIAGGADLPTGDEHACIWEGGQIRDLGTLGGAVSVAYGINEENQVVGSSSTTTGVRRAFLWENGAMRSLGALPGHQVSEALAINDHGVVVGYSRRREGDSTGPVPVLWQGDEIVSLQTRLAGRPAWRLTSAVDINNQGQIVGTGVFVRRNGGVLLTPSVNDISGSWFSVDVRCRGIVAPQCFIDCVLYIRNGGSTPIGLQRVNFYLSADAVLDSSDLLLTSKRFPPVGPGGVEPLRLQKRMSRGQLVSGRRVIAVLDADEIFTEENEANNVVVSGPLP